MIKEQNKEIIRQLYTEICSKKRNFKTPARGNSFTQYTFSSKPSNLKAFKNFFTAVAAAFPDYELTIENMIVKGDRVMVRYSITGTHEGIFMGLSPTHEQLTITGIDVFRLDDGKIIEHWDAAHQICALSHTSLQLPLSGNTSFKSDFINRSGSKLFSLKT